tara:strand:- start:308 stop:472 length:165 start_codon:yes stop_codon:yes gene_type:complete
MKTEEIEQMLQADLITSLAMQMIKQGVPDSTEILGTGLTIGTFKKWIEEEKNET